MAETIKPTEEALNYANQARIIKGWAKLSEQLKEASGVSISTLRRFWRPEAVKLDAARSICKALEIDFDKILLQGSTGFFQLEQAPLDSVANFPKKQGVITNLIADFTKEPIISTFRKILYLYYLSERNNQWFWRVVIVNFEDDSTPGKLSTCVKLRNLKILNRVVYEEYNIEGVVVTGKLSIYLAPVLSEALEPTTEFIFPFKNASAEQLAGIGHTYTWDHKHAWIPCLLTDAPLLGLDKEQEPIVEEQKNRLIKEWNEKINDPDKDCYLFPNDENFIDEMIETLKKLRSRGK
jgi:DNA-binding Xre family transcriptional regulator